MRVHELYSRELDVFDGLFLLEHPPLPLLVTIGHAAEDDLRHLQPGVAEAHWAIDASVASYYHQSAPSLP